MSVLSDKWIRKMSKEKNMIYPFEEKQVRGDSISYGLSSNGEIISFSLDIFLIHLSDSTDIFNFFFIFFLK